MLTEPGSVCMVLRVSYYRIHDLRTSHTSHAEDVADQLWCLEHDLLADDRMSGAWVGSYTHEDGTEDRRRGVSVCSSLADLRAYLSGREWYRHEDVLVVELDGELADDEDHEASGPGAPVLIIPSRVIAVHPLTILETDNAR